jgi:hypothetical protein
MINYWFIISSINWGFSRIENEYLIIRLLYLLLWLVIDIVLVLLVKSYDILIWTKGKGSLDNGSLNNYETKP